MIGMEVPSLTGEGTEILRDSNDAREWQDATRELLKQEVQARAVTMLEQDGTELRMLHSSVELFQNNADLVPGTTTFDKELADRFVRMAKPYEHRVDGKLRGYNIPVQPMVDAVRASLATERSAAPAAPATPAAPAAAAAAASPVATAAAVADPPEAGLTASAGQSGAPAEDYTTLFGTLGDLQLRL
mgnify:CR=1 FL=1